MKFQQHMMTAAVFACIALGLSGASWAQGEEGEAVTVESLKQGQDDIRKELAEIKKLLEQGARAAAAPSGPDVEGKIFNLGDNPAIGNDGAKIALLEFTDYQCPYCKRHTEQTQPQIQSEYIDGGKIRFVSLDMPLTNIHPLAIKAAEAAHCADEQGQYWQMRDRMFENQKALEPWNAHAEALGLNVAKFEKCLDSGKYTDAIKADLAEAYKAGATGTPSFVVAVIDDEDPTKVTGVSFIRGAVPFAKFKAALDEALTSLN